MSPPQRKGRSSTFTHQTLNSASSRAQGFKSPRELWLDPNLNASSSNASLDIYDGFDSDGGGTWDDRCRRQYDYPEGSGEEADFSDPDADDMEMEFAANMAKFRDTVVDQGATGQDYNGHRQVPKDESAREGPKARGPRKAAEPTGDIKLRLAQATEIFIQERYEEARNLASEIIRINAETFEAWTLLALCFEELEDTDKALMALMFAAHMRPRMVQAWINCAEFALKKTGENRSQYLPSVRFCYSAALRADPKCMKARRAKVEICLEMGSIGTAIGELTHLFKENPSDAVTAHRLALLHVDRGRNEEARLVYQACIAHLKADNNREDFKWTYASAYAAVFESMGDFASAIKELKSVARWFIGHGEDTYWDAITDDDREWDLDDLRRRNSALEDTICTSSYGHMLPIELRAQLGQYRLRLGFQDEAIRHFNCMRPWDTSQDDNASTHRELYHAIADELLRAECCQEALTFYLAVKDFPEHATPSLHMDIGMCYLKEKMHQQAEEYFQTVIQLDETSIDARRELAQMYEDLNEHEEALFYLGEIRTIRLSQQGRYKSQPLAPALTHARPLRPRYMARRLGPSGDREKQDRMRTDQLLEVYSNMQDHHERMRADATDSYFVWMDGAKEMTDDFRNCRLFYPWEYKSAVPEPEDMLSHDNSGLEVDSDLKSMQERLIKNLDATMAKKGPIRKPMPLNYRELSFDVWIDIFLEYAICLAAEGRIDDAYDICHSAYDAKPFDSSKEYCHMIHVCRYACALMANDDRTCVEIARYFMGSPKEFSTDSYRMFAAVARICQSPVSWYSSGPTQKYMLRQIKQMDERLHLEEESGPVDSKMSVALLMLYGQILYTGTSYAYALNYYFRAHALDPHNPTINLNVGITYLHYALKRQASNRQYLLVQGFSFLREYYEIRILSDVLDEREEAHYNMARAYHLVGLGHLAMPYYMKALQVRESHEGDVARKIHYNM